MKPIEITFPKLNHSWLDSGLLGLAVMLKEVNSSIDKTVNDTGLTLKGTESEIWKALAKAYDLLIERYYNLSTKKQRDNTSSYNFYYDSKEMKFVAFPKKKSVGIAELIYNKAPRPTGSSVKWEKEEKRELLINGKTVKRKRGILPPNYSYLQERMEKFLDEHGLDVTTSGLLIDGPNMVKPNVTIPKKFSTTIKGQCYLCGEDTFSLEEIGQTIFPFITGSSGLLNFNTKCSKPEMVCWKCAFIGKFVPVNGFYLMQGDNLFAFFPYSISFEKMLDVYTTLQDAKYEDPNLFKNFQHPLGFETYADGYFQKTFEVTFAFLYTLYRKVLLHQKADEDVGVLNWEEMCNLAISKAPLEFVVLHAESKGQTSMGKMVWPFRDSVYFFRLIKEIEENQINIKEVMRLLIDFSQKNQENKTILRNRFCERILKKKTVLDTVEERTWDIVFSQDQKNSKPQNPSPLIDFFLNYESIIKEGKMTDEERNVAVALGKTIGLCASKKDNETRSRNEIERDFKRLKGDLFKLKKVRKLTDFLSEIGRLEIRYDFSLRIPDGLLDGKLRDDNFKEFKGYCTIAAMQAYSNARYYALKEEN